MMYLKHVAVTNKKHRRTGNVEAGRSNGRDKNMYRTPLKFYYREPV